MYLLLFRSLGVLGHLHLAGLRNVVLHLRTLRLRKWAGLWNLEFSDSIGLGPAQRADVEMLS